MLGGRSKISRLPSPSQAAPSWEASRVPEAEAEGNMGSLEGLGSALLTPQGCECRAIPSRRHPGPLREALPCREEPGTLPTPWGTLLFPGCVGSPVLLIKASHSHPQPEKLI